MRVQLAIDEEKFFTWPLYVAALRARLRVPVWLQLASGETYRTEQEVSQARTAVRMHASPASRRLLLDPDRHLPRAVAREEAAEGFLDGRGDHGKTLIVEPA